MTAGYIVARERASYPYGCAFFVRSIDLAESDKDALVDCAKTSIMPDDAFIFSEQAGADVVAEGLNMIGPRQDIHESGDPEDQLSSSNWTVHRVTFEKAEAA